MRKVSLMLVAALLLSTGSIFANDLKKDGKPSSDQNLSEQIGELLSTNNLTENHIGQEAQVLFTLNSENEIVVLSVESDQDGLEGFIKGRLNYQTVNASAYKAGKNYTISVRIAS